MIMKRIGTLPLLLACASFCQAAVEENGAQDTLERRQSQGAFGGFGGFGGLGSSAPSQAQLAQGMDQLFDSPIAQILGIVNAPAKREKLEPVLQKNATRERLWFGPYKLPAQNGSAPSSMPSNEMTSMLKMDPNGVQLNRALTGFCTNCTVLYGKAALFYEDGAKASLQEGVYVHHIVIVDMTKKTFPFYLCKGQSGFLGTFPAAGFIVSGNDEANNWYTTPDGSFESGYGMGPKSRFAMQSELVNYKPVEQSVYITTEYEYVPYHVPDIADSTVSLFSVTGCEPPDYQPPDYHMEPQYNVSSDPVPMPMDGYIINAKGHLHDGGVNTLLTLNDKVICDSRPKYSDDTQANASDTAPDGRRWQTITQMSQCTEPVPVKKGDILQLKAYYDNALHPPREAADGHSGMSDEMGVFFVNFAATKPNTTVAAS